MRTLVTTFCVLTGMALTAAGQGRDRTLAIDELKGGSAQLVVTSNAFVANGAIPTRHSDYGEKFSPALAWTGVPQTARSLALLMEDPDAQSPKPFVHWVMYNLPPTIAALPEAVPTTPRLPEFGGVLQGSNSRGTTGYFGPRPPKGDPPHHYHVQLFAADTMLTVDPGASVAAVLAALREHVIGRGQIVGTFAAPRATAE